ncbi:dihydroxy-acid dehydratase [Escherichia coli]|uniref:dihydroxy-acid dehydratase domain-containing protein n=1 Tax=Escherichia coli TaxID=562 RepID=UPI0038906C30
MTDGRFSGGTSGLFHHHAPPEAASGGSIGLIEDGDSDCHRHSEPAFSYRSDAELRRVVKRRKLVATKPDAENRERQGLLCAACLRQLATSADKGAVRA